jgi:hypothetical protein
MMGLQIKELPFLPWAVNEQALLKKSWSSLSMETTLVLPGAAMIKWCWRMESWKGRIISSVNINYPSKHYWRHAYRQPTLPQGWNGEFEGDAYIGPGCTRIQGLGEEVSLLKQTLYALQYQSVP